MISGCKKVPSNPLEAGEHGVEDAHLTEGERIHG